MGICHKSQKAAGNYNLYVICVLSFHEEHRMNEFQFSTMFEMGHLFLFRNKLSLFLNKLFKSISIFSVSNFTSKKSKAIFEPFYIVYSLIILDLFCLQFKNLNQLIIKMETLLSSCFYFLTYRHFKLIEHVMSLSFSIIGVVVFYLE